MADAQYRCGYCLTSQRITAMPMHVEHIIPLAAGGTSAEEDLWLACPLCICVTVPRALERTPSTLRLGKKRSCSIHADTSGVHTFGGALTVWKFSVSRPVVAPRLPRLNSTMRVSPAPGTAGC
jgi:HNH endonuclease